MRVIVVSVLLLIFASPTVKAGDQDGSPLPPMGAPGTPVGPAPGGFMPAGPAPRGVVPGGPAPAFDDRESFFAPHPPLLVRDFGWSYIDNPKPHEVKVHDIVTVLVSEAAQTNANSTYNRQRNGQYTAQLANWIRINSSGNLAPAAASSPEINGQLQSLLQSTGTVVENEAMKYHIAATVVDVLPNGILVLEARKKIIDNKDLWEYSLTGKVRAQDIGPDNSARSENIADLQITKVQHGKLTDATQRAWFIRLYDWIGPF
jgi:flagellar L-ring protein FlgH